MVRGRALTAVYVGMMAAILVGCSDYGSGPAKIGATQNGIVVRADPANTSAEEVNARAQSFCNSYNKKAYRRGEGEYQKGVVYYTFDCVDPVTKRP